MISEEEINRVFNMADTYQDVIILLVDIIKGVDPVNLPWDAGHKIDEVKRLMRCKP